MVTSRLLTANDLWKLSESGEDYELIEGELVPVAPVFFGHGKIQGKIHSLILRYAEQFRLGEVAVEAGYILRRSPDTVLAPDVSFVAAERLPANLERYFSFAPDLAIEVVSSSNSPREIERKLAIYLQTGVRCVWIVHPRERQVVVHTPGEPPRTYKEADVLTGDPVLPGLSIFVSEIFE
jgi:Uma2 family endonuclease